MPPVSETTPGDPVRPELMPPKPEKETAVLPDIPVSDEPLLAWEKRRRAITRPPSLSENARYKARPLTGTLMGKYFRHQQCSRWFSFHFLASDYRPSPNIRKNDALATQRMEQGRAYEAEVLARLREQDNSLVTIPETGKNESPLNLKARFHESVTQLQRLVQLAVNNTEKPIWLVQGVLMADSLLVPSPHFFAGEQHALSGIGIPDLIRVLPGDDRAVLTVGDIKSSPRPYYYQKWQVAFYTFLLRNLLRSGAVPLHAEVSATGFLITRPAQEAALFSHHEFDLRPYMSAFGTLFRNLAACLSAPPTNADWQLQRHCTTCPHFEFCYAQALTREEIQFLPRMTLGILQKMRRSGLRTLQDTETWLEDPHKNNAFSPEQRTRLQGAVTALSENRIAVAQQKTKAFPARLSPAVFIHLVHDPVSRKPCGLGLKVLEGNSVREMRTWVPCTEPERAEVWRDFSARLLNLWETDARNSKRPHIFHFGAETREGLRQWAEVMEDMALTRLLRRQPYSAMTDLKPMIQGHFHLPVPGNLTRFSLSRILGLNPEPETPESLFHDDPIPDAVLKTGETQALSEYLKEVLAFEEQLWQWAARYPESERTPENQTAEPEGPTDRMEIYRRFIEAERAYQEADISALQALSLSERVERFRAIGPLTFTGTAPEDEGRCFYWFGLRKEAGLSKFRKGDFLKLVPQGVADLQSGASVILAHYSPHAGKLAVRSRQGHLSLHKGSAYSLEEDLSDWNTPRLLHAVQTAFSRKVRHPLTDLFNGEWDFEQPAQWETWVRDWLRQEGTRAQLNPSQQQALTLPFRRALSLIQGPPGTGKTHLLGWILIALMQHAYATGNRLRIVVSALTHQAIDEVLTKVAQLVNAHGLRDFPGRCVKWGRWDGPMPDNEKSEMQAEPMESGEAILSVPYLILGATGYGLYSLSQSRNGSFPKAFDWVIFDEASQVLVPQALLSLIYGRGNFLFTGDVYQLPPVIRSGSRADVSEAGQSLMEVLDRIYPAHSVRLNVTYRMNAEICDFPSRTWYDGELHPAPTNAEARLTLNAPDQENVADSILDSEKPVVLVLTDHEGCHQESTAEAGIMAGLAFRLMRDFGLKPDQVALISPHRAQNNAIVKRLGQLLGRETDLPLIDTVERLQGVERDVILFGLTTSDPDHVMGEFLNNPNRFNVAITRARKKLIVVGSRAFFSAIPRTEAALKANACFKAFYEHCQEKGRCFRFPLSDDRDLPAILHGQSDAVSPGINSGAESLKPAEAGS